MQNLLAAQTAHAAPCGLEFPVGKLCGICRSARRVRTWRLLWGFPPHRRACGSASAEPEGCIAVKVSCQEIPCCGEYLAYKAQPHQPCPHGEFRIVVLLGFRACRSDHFCHLAQCKAKLNVAFKLSCVKSVFLAVCRLVEVKASKFDSAFCKCCVVIQHMVGCCCNGDFVHNSHHLPCTRCPQAVPLCWAFSC